MTPSSKTIFFLLLILIITNYKSLAQSNLNDSATKKRVIIFVHGLSGSNESWVGSNIKYYDLLSKNKEIINNYDLDTTFTYHTKLVEPRSFNILKSFFKKSKKDKFNAPIRDIGLLLKSHIAENLRNYESFVLITHSMGGLVAKKAMVEMNKDVESQNFLSKIDLYVSLSVPHRGSLLASMAEKLIGKNPQLKNLKAFSSFTTELSRDYGSIKLDKRPKTIYQRGVYDKVVPEGSAIPCAESQNIIDTQDDHYGSRQVKDPKTHVAYKRVLRELKELLSESIEQESEIQLVPKIIFKASRKNIETEERVKKYFRDYSESLYSSSIELPSKLFDFHIEDDIHVCDGSYYFSEKKFLVQNDLIASDKDLINRIHTHAILHNVVREKIKKTEEIDRFWRVRQSGHKAPYGGITAAIESGICDYLVASYSNDPKIGETGYAKCEDTTVLRDISTLVTLRDIPINKRFYKQGIAWAGIFWDLEKELNDKDKVRRFAISFWVHLWTSDEKIEDWTLEKARNSFNYLFEDRLGEKRYKHAKKVFKKRGIDITKRIVSINKE